MAATSQRCVWRQIPPMVDRPGLIFDLDGTLIHSAPQIHDAALAVLASEGLASLDIALVTSFVGNGVAVLVGRILASQGLPTTGTQHDRMVRQFIKIYEQRFDLTTLYPNVVNVLHELASQGYPLAICTNKPERPTHAILRHFGLSDIFPVVVGGDTLPQRKPHPAPLLRAAALLGTARPVFIGDSEVDAETAVAAGLPFVWFSGGYCHATPQSLGATASFSDHAALPGLLDQTFPPEEIFGSTNRPGCR